MNRNSFLLLLIAVSLTLLGACGHRHHKQQQEIEVEISEAPPAALTANANAQVEATVTNDTANAGVTWSCTPAGTCGGFNPTTTASGAPTTYTAPAAAAAVTITATSVTDNTKTASSHVNVTSGVAVVLSTAPPANLVASTSAPVAATVTGDSANAGVDWTCAPAGSCGSFSPTHTASAAASTFTAPASAGLVTITATSTTDNTQKANANVTITSAGGGLIIVGTYSFYAAGTSVDDDDNYAIAGSITIGEDGSVTGEQDFNNGFSNTSPQPGGDAITSGVVDVDTVTGQGTLTLVTNNPLMGDNGTETLSVVFTNNKHALIQEFDGSAASLGSLDLQTLPSTPSGGFAFNFAGLDADDNPIGGGGVFTVNGLNLTNGLVDTNDSGDVTLAQAFTATLTAPDSFGRGTINNSGIANTMVYYLVGPKVLRFIVMDSTDFAVGSAYGQGTSTGGFSNAFIGKSVFSVSGASIFEFTLIVGQFSTGAAPAIAPAVAHPNGQPITNTFNGIADLDDEATLLNAAPISGSYFVSSDGYGRLTIANDPGFFNLQYGIYLIDPTLNLSDPNNTSTGLGGALMMNTTDFENVSVGVLVPQTDTASDSFSGGYAFGAQIISDDEADFVGQGTLTGNSLSGIADVNNLFEVFFSSPSPNVAIPFTGTVVPDLEDPGRSTMHFFNLDIGTKQPVEFDATFYQADGGQLFWFGATDETDSDSFFTGPVEQQSFVSDAVSSAAAKKTAPKK